jgi:hypothetical protein
MVKSTTCTIYEKDKKNYRLCYVRNSPPLWFNTATITIAYLIHYPTQLKIYPNPSLSKIPSSSSHLIQHLTPVYTTCIQFFPNSHTLKLIAFHINISNSNIYIYVCVCVCIYIYTHTQYIYIYIYSHNLGTIFPSLAAEKSGCVKYADFFFLWRSWSDVWSDLYTLELLKSNWNIYDV